MLYQSRTTLQATSRDPAVPRIFELEGAFARGVTGLEMLSGLTPQQRSLLFAARAWRELLGAPSEEAEEVKTYLGTMGYLAGAKRLLSQARRAGPISDEVFQSVVSALVESGRAADTPTVPRISGLSPSQQTLLSTLTAHQARLDGVDLATITSAFPFPITAHNFFGRFIAGGAEDPSQALRHLQLTMPFFVRMRGLLEALSAPRGRGLVIDWVSIKQPKERDGASIGRDLDGWEARMRTIVHACIDSADDMTAGAMPSIGTQFAVIDVPYLPGFSLDTVDQREYSQLAREYCDWLFMGDRSGKLLARRTLAPSEEASYRALEGRCRALTTQLHAHHQREPKADAPRGERRRWEGIESRLQRRIEKLEGSLTELDAKRSGVTPILRQLEGHEVAAARLHRFRSAVRSAFSEGRRIVLSFLGPQAKSEGSLFTLFDRAMLPRFSGDSPGLQVLRSAAFLFSQGVATRISESRSAAGDSANKQLLRNFQLVERDLSHSLERVVARVLPRRGDPKLTALAQALVSGINLPGIGSGAELVAHAQQILHHRPTPLELVEFAFERAEQVTTEALWKMLRALHSFGEGELTPRTRELYRERFHLPETILEQFRSYVHFRPQCVGNAPAVFENLTTFSKFCQIELDGVGMHPEVALLEEALCRDGIVVVIDSTNYHPELGSVVGDEKVKGDREVTRSYGGSYTRPSERLLLAFAQRMMDGSIAEPLRNSSMLLARKPTSEDKAAERFYKLMFGLDVSVTPDLAAVNALISDITVFDQRTILVVDAENVRHIEHFRGFLELLRQYQIRAIIRSRETFPGLRQVLVRPFGDHEIADRLAASRPALQSRLGVTVPAPTLELVARRVKLHRRVDEDPVASALRVLEGAAQSARHQSDETIGAADVVAALSPVFNLPNPAQVRHLVQCVQETTERLPFEVLGQEVAIRRIAALVQGHVMGLRDPTRPLAMLIPGPTGVGKTELMMRLAQALNFPFFYIEGSHFAEPNSINMLTGSPSGYVGPDKGPLYLFLEENPYGVVFCDEIEKMHPAVYTALMQFFDKGSLTAGDGSMVFRPGMIIAAASNAGADRLREGMNPHELRTVLAEAFVDAAGRPRPELVARFDPVPMLAIAESDFRKVIALNIRGLGDRTGFVSAGLQLTEVDPDAIALLYEEAQEQCSHSSGGLTGGIGFRRFDSLSGLFYDMRHVSRALDVLAREALHALVLERSDELAVTPRGPPCPVRLIGDRQARRIRFERIAVA